MNYELAKKIYQISHITGEFLLRSGAVSNEYFDKYLFESQPEIIREIGEEMSRLLPSQVDAIAGLEMGGIPIATIISQIVNVPTLFVRKKAKEYGTRKLVEGGDVRDKKIVIIEDVVTSGGQILLSVKDLRQLGANIDTVLCVIDRESGGKENLAKEGLELKSLFKMSELKSG